MWWKWARASADSKAIVTDAQQHGWHTLTASARSWVAALCVCDLPAITWTVMLPLAKPLLKRIIVPHHT